MSSDLQKANKLFREGKYHEAARVYALIKEDDGALPRCYEFNLAKCIQLIEITKGLDKTTPKVEKIKAKNKKRISSRKVKNRCDLNSFDNGILTGWAIDYDSVDKPVKISIYINSQFDGSIVCNSYRKDLELSGVGDGLGRYAFNYRIKSDYENISTLEIACKLEDDRNFDSGKAFLKFDRHAIMKGYLASYCDNIRRIYEQNIFKDYRILMSNLVDAKNSLNQSAKISIIMPTYNRKEIILRAIDSILSQSYTNWELLICDDGSTDGTYQHVKQYTDDKRIRYLNLDHGGVSQARNSGLEASSGDYIAFLDSDNTWHTQFLNIMLSYINIGNLDAAYCQISIKGQKNIIKGYRGDIFSWQSCLKKNYIDMNCFIHKANSRALQDNIIVNARFDINLKRLVDWDYILRVTKDSKVSFCPLPLVSYYDGDDYERITKTVYTEGDVIQEYIKSIQSKHYHCIHTENLDQLIFIDIIDNLHQERARSENNKPALYYFPDYTSTNSYQDLFYESMRQKIDITASDIDSLISAEINNINKAFSSNTPKIFHIHWQNAFFNNKETDTTMRLKVNATIKKIELLKKVGFKIVWTVHNIKSHESRHELYEIELIKNITSLADHIIVHDLKTLELVKPWYTLPLTKVIVCPHAGYQNSINITNNVDTLNQLKQKYSLPKDAVVFAAIGQIRSYKKLENLVEVFLKISKEIANIFLFIAGKPVHCDTSFLEDAANDNPNILLELGFISNEQLSSYMKDIDCLILNYSNVLTSGSYHLAETVGCPVICPDQGLLSSHIRSCNAVFGFGIGDKALEQVIRDFINEFKLKHLELSKSMLAKSSEVSWKLAADKFSLNLQLSPTFEATNIKYSNICHSWFVNTHFQNHSKKSEILAVVVHYSNINDTLEIVSALENQAQRVDILVVCNSESPDDFLLLTSSLSNIPIVQKQTNGGYASGINLGLHISIKYNYEYFWILNPDLEMKTNTSERFLNTLTANKDMNIIGCTLTGYGEISSSIVKFCGGEISRSPETIGTKHMFDGSNINAIPVSPFQCDYLTGANIFGRVSVLDDLGFLPEELFLYFEETIWLERYVQRTGDKPWILPDLIIKNKKRSENSFLPTYYYFYYMIRNWLVFASFVCDAGDFSNKMPESLKHFISAWFNKIKSKRPDLLNEYINIASCAYEHGLLEKTGINTNIKYFSLSWSSRFGINKLIASLL